MELRRPLTAAAAAAVLIGVMFVPSASAFWEAPAPAAPTRSAQTRLPSGSGSAGTTRYMIGGSAFLGISAGFALRARRREQREP